MVIIFILSFLGIAFAYLTADTAQRRGRSMKAWMCLGLIFGPFAWLTVALLPPLGKKRRSDMSAQDLDEMVTLCPHNPLWFDEASRLVSRIAKDLCDLGVKVEHIGSTAVPGLEAKPIIDLIAGLTDQRSIDEAARRLSAIGWQDLGEAGVIGRRYMRIRGGLASNLHLVLVDQGHWANNLALRDYLRSHPNEAAEYGAAKRKALAAGHTRLLAYSAAKAEQLAALLSRAKAWSQRGR
jgi:GrpB-like predicted nucleotidyltransferase (UPF0157 family)